MAFRNLGVRRTASDSVSVISVLQFGQVIVGSFVPAISSPHGSDSG